jgi:hypothetical protein
LEKVPQAGTIAAAVGSLVGLRVAPPLNATEMLTWIAATTLAAFFTVMV